MPEELCVIEPYSTLPCKLQTFLIKGSRADADEFGSAYDGQRKCSFLLDFKKKSCGDRYFKTLPYKSNKEVADKYGLSEYEYKKVCEELEDKLCVGKCEWCR